MVMGSKSIRNDAKTFDDSEALAAAVSGDVAGIGYVGLPFVKDTTAIALQDGDGEPLHPTVFTVATEDYPLSRRLHLYTAESPSNPLVRQFVSFVESEEGQQIVERAGFASLELRPESPAISARVPKEYRNSVEGAERLSVDFRFRTGSAQLDARAQTDLDRVLRYMSQPAHRAARLLLEGFADSNGSEKANLELSKARAESVAKELRSRGLSPAASGWGSALPIAPNNTAEGRERNRRVELWIH
jgi:phosphate transport system substrate-binding protein